jgi:hypothetical protein
MSPTDPSQHAPKTGEAALQPLDTTSAGRPLKVTGSIQFNIQDSQNVTVNILQENVTNVTVNFVQMIEALPEVQRLPEEQRKRVLDVAADTQEAVEAQEPSFLKSCLKKLYEEGKDVAAAVIAKLIIGS